MAPVCSPITASEAVDNPYPAFSMSCWPEHSGEGRNRNHWADVTDRAVRAVDRVLLYLHIRIQVQVA